MATVFGVAEETAQGIHDGRRRVVETHLIGLGGQRIAAALALPLRSGLEGAARALALVRPPLVEAVRQAGPASGPAALFVCVPPAWEAEIGALRDFAAGVNTPAGDEWKAVRDALAGELATQGVRVPEGLRFLVRCGHAAGMIALSQAAALFDAGQADGAFVVGLDDQGERSTLERLDRLGLSKSVYAPNGFVPGEAAAVLCVRRALSENAGGLVVRGFRHELEREVPSRALALTEAIEGAIEASGVDASEIRTVVLDANGDRERAKEWTFASMRTLSCLGAQPVAVRPADVLGDVGAASTPLFVGLLDAMRIEGAALVVTSSRGGFRGAAVVTRGVADP